VVFRLHEEAGERGALCADDMARTLPGKTHSAADLITADLTEQQLTHGIFSIFRSLPQRGSRGHAIVPTINSAVQFWSKQRQRNVNYVYKGQNLRTEMYSAIHAEVEDPMDHTTGLNEPLIQSLRIADRLLVCGQASSHSVNYTTRGER
jgi:nicotinamidase-related amidase